MCTSHTSRTQTQDHRNKSVYFSHIFKTNVLVDVALGLF